MGAACGSGARRAAGGVGPGGVRRAHAAHRPMGRCCSGHGPAGRTGRGGNTAILAATQQSATPRGATGEAPERCNSACTCSLLVTCRRGMPPDAPPRPPPRIEAVMATTSPSMRRTEGKTSECMGLVRLNMPYTSFRSALWTAPAMYTVPAWKQPACRDGHLHRHLHGQEITASRGIQGAAAGEGGGRRRRHHALLAVRAGPGGFPTRHAAVSVAEPHVLALLVLELALDVVCRSAKLGQLAQARRGAACKAGPNGKGHRPGVQPPGRV